MCRMLIYQGKPIKPETLLYHPDNSLMTQTYSPKLINMKNLAGFGMALWSQDLLQSSKPLIYKTTQLSSYDKNLYYLSNKLKCNHLLAHIRGTPLTHKAVTIESNSHPFNYEKTNICFAHNGVLTGFSILKQDFTKYIKPEIFNQISGTTDSEWLYALFLSQLDNLGEENSIQELSEALINMLRLVRFLRNKRKINTASPMNIFISDGTHILCLRFVFDYGHFKPNPERSGSYYTSLWFTFGYEYKATEDSFSMSLGEKNIESIIIASEPLTLDPSTWLELPEYTLLTVEKTANRLIVCNYDIDI